MSKKAFLVLEDRSFYEGYSFGAATFAHGEVVFNTSMTGYQEMLTDPSYAGQILLPTYPLIGNYGINRDDFESRRIQVRGFVVREECREPSHWRSTASLHSFLADAGVPGVCGLDTRAITRHLRSRGVMMGAITVDGSPEEALARLRSLPRYDNADFVREVTADAPYEWRSSDGRDGAGPHIVVLDCGLKYNILRILSRSGCRLTAVPCTHSTQQILDLNPDGVLLSPGPGDPALLDYVVATVKGLVGVKPIMGICLGEQLIGRAFGATTFKLKFGHRGGNHPVKDLKTGRVHITAQNHGYAVDAESVRNGLEVSHINLNDGTVEGLRHRDLPILSIQYHSEASPGPQDNVYLFDRFLDMVNCQRNRG
ncbi:MAG: glutamine-hydrolyzing carbamoyl-phosphate synthase small subunit [Chloroflexi bacterium]|nr:glutamine-hydrolyzing carbamoyl-phosphate synthase small subunit [Chloroflexota bacterium]